MTEVRPLTAADRAPWPAPPVAGRDTDRVLRELVGLDEDAIASLRASGAV